MDNLNFKSLNLKIMKMTKKTLKAIVLSMVLAAGLLSPATLPAQEQHGRPGGLFGQTGGSFGNEASNGLMNRDGGAAGGYFTGQGFGSSGAELTGQTFGEEAPLGSGLFVLLAASAGYATLRTKKKQQNGKENKA